MIIVTGATGGMGRAISTLLAPTNPLLLVDRDADALESFCSTLGGVGHSILAVDVSNKDAAAQIASRAGSAGGFSALVHTAGLSPTMADARTIIDVNLCATQRLVDALLPHVEANGVAVLFASIAGHSPADPKYDVWLDAPLEPDALDGLSTIENSTGAYGLSKRGVIRMCERLVSVWGQKGARIVSLSPGIIDTPMAKQEFEQQPVMAQMIAHAPVPRLGFAQEIAETVAFLISSGAGYITGTDVRVDGGVVSAMRAQR